jgi:CheY-like chemotaxis protein
MSKIAQSPPSSENFMAAFRVLSIGYDVVLMPVRSMLLRQEGYEVVETYSVGEGLRKIKAGGFDLLLMCHTIPSDQQQELIEALHLAQPGLPFLCLTTTPEYSDFSHCPPACSTAPELLADISNALHPERRGSWR